ncbi:unnamed protein product [Dicrocoelium dendriticum]|nr:unnamed protein product [Dicrocoelium dendriticum]
MFLTLLPVDPVSNLYHNLTLSLSGIKAPTIRFEDGKQVCEPFALDAQFFVESRLLQRDVFVLLEGTWNQTFIGSVIHPNGNIAEVLLREGLAKCLEWNLSVVSIPGASEAYRISERSAKEKRLRLWKDYQPLTSSESLKNQDPNKTLPGTVFHGTVVEVGNGDNVSVKCLDGVVRKFFLSSIRAPRPIVSNRDDEDNPSTVRPRIRPLYDVPYMFESRELLRNYVGKSVTVHVDYIQPKTANALDERICGTIHSGSTNLAECLVSKGLANVIRYRNANDPRTVAYTELLAAEELAQTNGLGLFNKRDVPVHRVVDLTGNLAKSRQFLPFLKRAPQSDAVVEFVVHASRLRVYLPRDTCLLTLLLSGIQCPRRGRLLPDGTEEPGMPFSTEAYIFVKELCMQRDVEVTVETMDRVGNFVGWLFVDGASVDTSSNTPAKSNEKKKKKPSEAPVKPKVNLSVLLVSRGFATVHRAPSTEASPYYHDLDKAEETAKSSRLGLWSSEEFVKQWEAELNSLNDTTNSGGADEDRLSCNLISGYLDDLSILPVGNSENGELDEKEATRIHWKPAQVTAISKPGSGSEGLRFFVQHPSDSATIIKISQSLNSPPPPPIPNYQPKKGELCAASFSLDNCWYRARVVRRNPKSITVQFVDFGNEETIEIDEIPTRVSQLPYSSLASIPPQAHEYRLAFVQLPPDATNRSFAEHSFAETVENKEVLLAVQFDPVPCANETIKPVPGVAIKVPCAGTPGSSESSPWIDVAYQLLEEGLVCVEPMRPQLLKPASRVLLPGYLEAQAKAKKERKNIWCYGDFRVDTNQ